MPVFSQALLSVDSEYFDTAFKLAFKSLSVDQLQLQKAVRNGSIALTDGITVMLIACLQTEHLLKVKAGIFFRSMIAGCHCHDDPGPIDTLEEYTQAWFSISKKDGSFSITFE